MHRDEYSLRNEREKKFVIEAKAEGEGAGGSVVRATVSRYDGLKFRYEVVFRGEYASTKANFTEEMYLLTGLSLVKSQIESHRHVDTRIVLDVNSGLPITEVGAKLDWE